MAEGPDTETLLQQTWEKHQQQKLSPKHVSGNCGSYWDAYLQSQFMASLAFIERPGHQKVLS